MTFADDGMSEYESVGWATGLTTDRSLIDVPGVKDEQGRIRHQRGVPASSGLHMLGWAWPHTRRSALPGGVGTDAILLAEQIASADS